MSKWIVTLKDGTVVGVEMQRHSPNSKKTQDQLQEVIHRHLRKDKTKPNRKIKDWEMADAEQWDKLSCKIIEVPSMVNKQTPAEQTQVRRMLLAESLGYWRIGDMSNEEGNGVSVEVLMHIGVAYGRQGEDGAKRAMWAANVPERYWNAILDTLKVSIL